MQSVVHMESVRSIWSILAASVILIFLVSHCCYCSQTVYKKASFSKCQMIFYISKCNYKFFKKASEGKICRSNGSRLSALINNPCVSSTSCKLHTTAHKIFLFPQTDNILIISFSLIGTCHLDVWVMHLLFTLLSKQCRGSW